MSKPTHTSIAFARVFAEPLAAALKTASRVKPEFIRLYGDPLLKVIRVYSASTDSAMRTLAFVKAESVSAEFNVCVATAIAQWAASYDGGMLELEVQAQVSQDTGEVEEITALNVRGPNTKSTYAAIVPQYDASGAMLVASDAKMLGMLEVSVGDFERFFPAVAMAASSSASQPMLNVVALELTDAGKLVLRATDGFRVHRTNMCEVSDWSGDPVRALIPMQSVALALDARGGELVRIEAYNTYLRFAFNDELQTRVEVQTIAGTYPGLDALIDPALDGTTKVAIGVKELTSSIDRLAKLAKDANIVMVVTRKSVTIENAGDNCGVDTIPTGEPAKGDDARIVVAPKYLRDAAEACGHVATLSITAPNKPISLVGGGLTTIVMPINPKATA